MGQKEERGYTMRQKNEGAVETKGAGLNLPSVYIRGVRISCKECGYSYGTERTRVHYERERTVPLILYLAFVL